MLITSGHKIDLAQTVVERQVKNKRTTAQLGLGQKFASHYTVTESRDLANLSQKIRFLFCSIYKFVVDEGSILFLPAVLKVYFSWRKAKRSNLAKILYIIIHHGYLIKQRWQVRGDIDNWDKFHCYNQWNFFSLPKRETKVRFLLIRARNLTKNLTLT